MTFFSWILISFEFHVLISHNTIPTSFQSKVLRFTLTAAHSIQPICIATAERLPEELLREVPSLKLFKAWMDILLDSLLWKGELGGLQRTLPIKKPHNLWVHENVENSFVSFLSSFYAPSLSSNLVGCSLEVLCCSISKFHLAFGIVFVSLFYLFKIFFVQIHTLLLHCFITFCNKVCCCMKSE